MTGVQLIGSRAVLQRYEKLNAEAWALYQGKQFIVGGVGGEDLRDWVADFEQSGSTATYTLRVYDCSEAPTCSTGAADYIASVNFKVVDQYEGYGIAGHSNKLMERIKGLEDKLKEKDEDQDEDEGQDLNSIIMGWLTEPQKLGMVVGAVRQLFGMASPLPIPAPVSGTQPQQTINGFSLNKESETMSAEQTLERLSRAIDTLEKHDPDLVAHLEKLAKLAQTDQLLFKAIISKLDAL